MRTYLIYWDNNMNVKIYAKSRGEAIETFLRQINWLLGGPFPTKKTVKFLDLNYEREKNMGYTHYWSFTAPKRGETAKIEKAYQKAIKDCAKIARAYYTVNGGLSGYTAQTPLGSYGGLLINGKGDDAHEPFSMREYFKQNLEDNGGDFCKTARKPYDVVVTACLIVLANALPKNFRVDSDGNKGDFVAGLDLTRRVLKKRLEIPSNLRDTTRLKILND